MADNPTEYNPIQSKRKQDMEFSVLIRESDKKKTRGTWLPGLTLVILIGISAYGLSSLHPSLDALAVAIIIGLVIRAIFGKVEWYLSGVRLGLKIFLPLGVILYGTNLSFEYFSSLSSGVITLTLLCMVIFYVAIVFLNRAWKLTPKTGELIADGSAICGAPAIAVLSPAVEAEPKDTSISILVVTTIGLLGLMIYPILRELLNLPDTAYAVLSGATLHQMGTVHITVASMDAKYIAMALAVKSIRIFMLLPIAILSVFWQNRLKKGKLAVDKQGFWKGLRRVWFLLPFLLMVLLVSLPATSSFLFQVQPWAVIVFSIALGSIGLLVDTESVISAGSRPLFVGLMGWMFAVLFFLLTWSIFL